MQFHWLPLRHIPSWNWFLWYAHFCGNDSTTDRTSRCHHHNEVTCFGQTIGYCYCRASLSSWQGRLGLDPGSLMSRHWTATASHINVIAAKWKGKGASDGSVLHTPAAPDLLFSLLRQLTYQLILCLLSTLASWVAKLVTKSDPKKCKIHCHGIALGCDR